MTSLFARRKSVDKVSSPALDYQASTERNAPRSRDNYDLLDLTPSRSSSISQASSSLPAYDDSYSIPPSFSSDPCADGFAPTSALQIETQGKAWLSLPLPPKPDPIPVFAIDPQSSPSYSADPKYISLRNDRRSGNSVLVRGSRPHGPALATTLYRFGLGRPPQLRLFQGADTETERDAEAFGALPDTLFDEMEAASHGKAEPKDAAALDAGADEPPAYTYTSSREAGPYEGVRRRGRHHRHSDHRDEGSSRDSYWEGTRTWTAPITPASWRTRSTRVATPHGTFQWRYASRSERKRFDANSVLVFERIAAPASELDCEASSSSSSSSSSPQNGKTRNDRKKGREEGERGDRIGQRTREVDDKKDKVLVIGYLVRNAETRTRGSGRSTAGNGGRLLLDLRTWDPVLSSVGAGNDDKGRLADLGVTPECAAEEVEQIAVASCLCMLKKEVDRRRLHQMMLIAGGASGGP